MPFSRCHLLLIMIAFLFTSCSSIMVSQDYDPSISFERYDRFTLVEEDPEEFSDPRYDNELINSRFNRTITSMLQEKGFAATGNVSESDFTVSFDYSVRPKMDLYNINKQVGFSYGSYNRYGGIGAKTCTDISEFDQGILFINIRDAQTEKLIWQGLATDIVSIHDTPENISDQVEEMVGAVLGKFPPD